MAVLIGLGNPGKEYYHTRHNAGFELIDSVVSSWPEFAKATLLKKCESELWAGAHHTAAKPQTFMNDSGVAVRQVLNYYADFKHQPTEALKHLFVAHDDLDLELGAFKIQFGKGPKIHNGLLSIYRHLGSDQFWHVRLGVDGRAGDRTLAGHVYVLQEFRPTERSLFEATLQSVADQLQHQWHTHDQR